jgi:hypothetical protein
MTGCSIASMLFFRPRTRDLCRAAIVALLTIPVQAFSAPEGTPVDTEQLLKAVTPAYPAPYPEFSTDWQPLAVRLLGVDLAQNGLLVAGERPILDSAFPLTVTCYWLAEAEVTKKRGLELKVASPTGLISKTEEVKAGPGATGWEAGSVYRQSFELALAPVAATITGDAMLVLSLFPRQDSSRVPVALQRVALHISPSPRPGRVSERSLRAAIAGDYHDLSTSFRLGRNARQEIQIPPEARGPATAIGVISSASYGSAPQNEPVCEVVAKSESAATHTYSLRSGVDTARSDFDFYAPGSVNHEKATVIESWDAEYPDVFNNPFKKHMYLALFPLPAEVLNLASIEFISKTPFVLDVFDVVLIRTPQETQPDGNR